MNDERFQEIVGYLKLTLSDDSNVRETAEQVLYSALCPKFGLRMLEFVNNNNLDMAVRLAGVAMIKNFDDESAASMDRKLFEDKLFETMLHAPAKLQQQLICLLEPKDKYDLRNLPQLLDEILQKLLADDLHVINGALELAHMLFKRYRDMVPFQATLFGEFDYVLLKMAKPLTLLLQNTMKQLKEQQHVPDTCKLLYRCLLLINKVFFSLSSLYLNPHLEQNLKIWMDAFVVQIAIVVPDVDDNAELLALLKQLQAQILKNIDMYMREYPYEFQPYVKQLNNATWQHLFATSTAPDYQTLVARALQYLDEFQNGLGMLEPAGSIASICLNMPHVIRTLTLVLQEHERSGLIPESLWPIFRCLLAPALWELADLVTPLTSLLATFIRQGAVDIEKLGKLPDILDILKKLLASKAHTNEAFYLLHYLLAYYPLEKLQNQMSQIFGLLYPHQFFSNQCVLFFCFYAVHINASSLIQNIENIEHGLFGKVLEHMLPTIKSTVYNRLEAKTVTAGIAKILTESPEIRAPQYKHYWPPLMTAILDILETPIAVDDSAMKPLLFFDRKMMYKLPKVRRLLAKNLTFQMPGLYVKYFMLQLEHKYIDILKKYYDKYFEHFDFN